MASEKGDAKWEQLMGADDWRGLLEPLDLSLRRLILRCGDLCQVTYDSFNADTSSPYCGSSRYGRSSIFKRVRFPGADILFEGGAAAAFLYATARVGVPEAFLLRGRSDSPQWDRDSNWMGYVAVSAAGEVSGRRVIYVAWRGTIRDYEWVNVLGADPDPAAPLLNSDDNEEAQVMRGWLTMYTSNNPSSAFAKASARDQLRAAIQALAADHRGESLSVVLTGHSLGACLAVLSAFDLAENNVVPAGTPVTAVVFGCPMVGNKAFRRRAEKHPNLKILHVRNAPDLITKYPGKLLGYVKNPGSELVVDTRKSPELKSSQSPADWHNLQAILHAVAAWNGASGEFEMVVERSLALVNKSSDILKESHGVPPSWWVVENKGMVFDESTGEWVLAPPDDEDLPEPPSLLGY